MKYLKSTLESFKENELLSSAHKLQIKGGLPVDWIEIGAEEDVEYDENGDPVSNGTGPRGGSSSSQSATSGASLGNNNSTGNIPPIVGG